MELPFKINNEEVGRALQERGASAVCHYCGNNNWSVLPEAALIPQWNNILPAPGIPVAVLICNKCGNIRMNALGSLRMLPEEKEGK